MSLDQNGGRLMWQKNDMWCNRKWCPWNLNNEHTWRDEIVDFVCRLTAYDVGQSHEDHDEGAKELAEHRPPQIQVLLQVTSQQYLRKSFYSTETIKARKFHCQIECHLYV